MAPNLEEYDLSLAGLGLQLILSPIHDVNPVNDYEISVAETDDVNLNRVNIPLEQNLRDLLVKVTNTEDLDTVTQLKLRVITRDVPLQYLGVYTPALRELILDGSLVSTLRDIGCGVKNLKILKVNRCSLESLDGVFSLENLEELYAADNFIGNLLPCAFLSDIKVLDLSRNRIKTFNDLNFLSVCENLKHLHLEGNDEISRLVEYRQAVKTLLPALKSLDGSALNDEEGPQDDPENLYGDNVNHDQVSYNNGRTRQRQVRPASHAAFSPIHGLQTPRSRPSPPPTSGSFTVRFPPRVFLGSPKKD